MGWLCRSPIPVGRRGSFTRHGDHYLHSRRLGEEEERAAWEIYQLTNYLAESFPAMHFPVLGEGEA
jgi:hypothetical protein